MTSITSKDENHPNIIEIQWKDIDWKVAYKFERLQSTTFKAHTYTKENRETQTTQHPHDVGPCNAGATYFRIGPDSRGNCLPQLVWFQEIQILSGCAGSDIHNNVQKI